MGSLLLTPIVTGINSLGRLTNEEAQGYWLKVTFTQSGNTSHWYLSSAGNLPKASAVAEVDAKTVRQHKWILGNNPWPLWFVKRVSEEGASNCSFQNVLVRGVNTFAQDGGGEPFADNFDVTLPLLVNHKALAQGEELQVHWPCNIVVKKSRRRKTITWETEARTAVVKHARVK